jgi:hypothetical protein
MSQFERFFKVLSLYLEARIRIRIRIKMISWIRILKKVMHIRNTAEHSRILKKPAAGASKVLQRNSNPKHRLKQ